MSFFLKLFYPFVMLILFTNCATYSHNFKIDTVDNSKDGIFFGRVRVYVDGKDITSKCYFQVWDVNESRAHISIPKSGLIIGKILKGKTHLRAILCADGMSSHRIVVENDNINFQNAGDGISSYFGDIKAYWSSEDVNPLWYLLGPGAAAGAGKSGKGFVISIQDNMIKTTHDIEKLINNKLQTSQKLFLIPKEIQVSDEEGKNIIKKMSTN